MLNPIVFVEVFLDQVGNPIKNMNYFKRGMYILYYQSCDGILITLGDIFLLNNSIIVFFKLFSSNTARPNTH
jgi:hypothetical protein